jgi:hypothetical protein
MNPGKSLRIQSRNLLKNLMERKNKRFVYVKLKLNKKPDLRFFELFLMTMAERKSLYGVWTNKDIEKLAKK